MSSLSASTTPLCNRLELVLRLHPPYLVWISIGINTIASELVLREASQQCAHNSYEICSLRHELVLRDIPGKSIQRGRQSQRFLGRIQLDSILNPASGKVIRMPGHPLRLVPLVAQPPAIRPTASPLARTYSVVGTEPAIADAAGTLRRVGHDDSSSRPRNIPFN
jgi:hypothetical protein